MTEPTTAAADAKAIQKTGKKADPEVLDSIDLRIIAAMTMNPEVSQKEIAEALELSVRTVSRHIQRPVVAAELKAAYTKACETSVRIARAYMPRAVRVLVDIVKSAEPTQAGFLPPRAPAEDRDVIKAFEQLRSIAFDPKLTIDFSTPLAVTHALDITLLSNEQLEQLATIVAAGAAAQSGAVTQTQAE